jgi:hypothetical protein
VKTGCKEIFLAAGFIMILLTSACFSTASAQQNITSLDFETISKGYYCGCSEPASHVINDEENWEKIWGLLFWGEKPAPEIDFSAHTVIAAFMGQFPTGGYTIEIKEIAEENDKIIVKVEKSYPAPGAYVTEAFSQPYHVVKTGKINKKVIFETREVGLLNELGVVQVDYNSSSATLLGHAPEQVIVKKPYIYLYAPRETFATVKVTFLEGSPSLTIPEATTTENSILWENVRITADGIAYRDAFFPCLFYEGKIAYDNPLQVDISREENDIACKVKNLGKKTLENIYIICKPGDYLSSPDYAYIYLEKLEPQELREVSTHTISFEEVNVDKIIWDIAQMMANEGICQPYAENFVREWADYWFYPTNQSFAQAIYQIPLPVIEEKLPLTVETPPEIELRCKRSLWALVQNIPIGTEEKTQMNWWVVGGSVVFSAAAMSIAVRLIVKRR